MKKTKEHKEIIRDYVTCPILWRLLEETDLHLILQHRITKRLWVCPK